jgi:hypothetical protein
MTKWASASAAAGMAGKRCNGKPCGCSADRRRRTLLPRPLVREVVVNEAFDGLDLLLDRLADRCKRFMEHPETIQGAIANDWGAALNQ